MGFLQSTDPLHNTDTNPAHPCSKSAAYALNGNRAGPARMVKKLSLSHEALVEGLPIGFEQEIPTS